VANFVKFIQESVVITDLFAIGILVKNRNLKKEQNIKKEIKMTLKMKTPNLEERIGELKKAEDQFRHTLDLAYKYPNYTVLMDNVYKRFDEYVDKVKNIEMEAINGESYKQLLRYRR